MTKEQAHKAPDYHIFWYAKEKNSDSGTTLDGIKIDYHEFIQLLYEAGFRFTKINDNAVFYQITSNRILKQVEMSDVSQWVIRY